MPEHNEGWTPFYTIYQTLFQLWNGGDSLYHSPWRLHFPKFLSLLPANKRINYFWNNLKFKHSKGTKKKKVFLNDEEPLTIY
jgi:hypothetical protein